MSQQQVRYLFSACIDSSAILGTDKEFRDELIAKRARLSPTQIGPDGRILEWLQPYKELEPQHRHVSHLWGLYPGNEISPYTTPQLADAARKSLEVRGDESVGWSLAYRAALWAALGDGDHAWTLLRNAVSPANSMDISYTSGGGVYPNMFDTCPPFQIDGNFGATAAIAEMLMQSGDGQIRLLPALPGAWRNGSVKGLCARGDFEVSLIWQDGKLTSATIQSKGGGPCEVTYQGHSIKLNLKKGESISLDGDLNLVRL